MIRRFLVALSRSRRLADFAADSRLAWLGARRFVAGQTLAECIEVVRQLNRSGMSVTLDRVGEGSTTDEEALRARDAYLDVLSAIRESGVEGGVSLKLTSLGLAYSHELTARLLKQVVGRASEYNPAVFVTIDMEDSPYVQQTLDIFQDLRAELDNVGAVIQSYLYRSDEDIEDLIKVGARVRMVKGAYVEPADIAYQDKADVDAAFVRQSERLMSPEARANGVYAALGTHDEEIINWAKDYARRHDVPRDTFEFQMLFGIRRDLQAALVAEGYRMRIYVPYGRLWYPYYMRRLAEQPQNMVWVVQGMLRELVRGF